jgi:adenylate cyclase
MSDRHTSSPFTESSEDSTPRLSPGVSYYLRRLLRQNLDRLAMADAGALGPTLLNTLEALIQSEGSQSLRTTLRALEDLAQRHQTLSNQGLKSRQLLRSTEAEIFQYLGLTLKEESQQATLLIVDDTPDNLRLLSTALTQHGYTVRSAINGALALSSAQVIKPDLILLDIMMPGLSGYDVCERLKADPKTSDIPVIFISAIDDALDKVKAFSVGGVDYITKPFQIEEVLVRIEHQLKIWNLQKRLEEQSIRFQQEILERQRADDRSRQLFEKAVDGVYQLAPDGKFLRVNQDLADLYGYDSPEALIAAVTAQKLYVKPGQYALLANQLQGEPIVTDFESEIYQKNGNKLWISETARAVRDDFDNLLYYEGTVTNISARKEAEDGWRRGRRRTKRLLLTLFPKVIAQQVGKGQEASLVNRFPDSTVLFANVVGFSPLTQNLAPVDGVGVLAQLFFEFNRLAERLNIEPIKTLGTRYLAVSGLPVPDADHPQTIANFALGLQAIVAKQSAAGAHKLSLQVGIHSGPVIAGVIGRRKMSYDLWGQTVHVANHLEQEGMPGQIQVSATTYESLKSRYQCTRRGSLTLPDGNTILTYWLQGGISETDARS